MLNRYKVKVRNVIWSIVRKVTQQKRLVWGNPQLKATTMFANNIMLMQTLFYKY